MRTHSIAAIPADGIGPEVIAAGVRVLEALAEAQRRHRLQRQDTSTGARTITRSTA